VTIAAPLWLVGLVPLAAVVLYLLWGRRRQVAVPFLALWLGPVQGPLPRRRFAAPPVALALAILAMVLAVVGGARPVLQGAGRAQTVTVIVDRGATMSAGHRVAKTASAVASALVARDAPPVNVILVPGGEAEHAAPPSWAARVGQLGPTALDTTAALDVAVSRALAAWAGPVVVVTDRKADDRRQRLVRAWPATPVRNAGIVLLAARAQPRGQVMVRVRNAGGPDRRELRVASAGREVVRTVNLPASPEETRDYFMDVEAVGDVVKAELRGGDDFAGDDAAWLVREGAAPRIEPRGNLPPKLRRMIDVYASANPPGADAPVALVARDAEALAPTSAGVVLAEASSVVADGAAVEVRPHPVTRDMRWSLGRSVRLAAPPAGDWTVVVAVGGRAAVAVRESPARQVWVGIESEEWPRTPDYVVFWANVFDWLAGGQTRYVCHAPGRLEGGWKPVELAGGAQPAGGEAGLWPGLYRREEDGALRAVNAGDVRFPEVPPGDWRPRLERVLAAHSRSTGSPLAPALLLAALGCAALAAALWRRSPNRSAGRYLAAT
jgi:hypothetical protein